MKILSIVGARPEFVQAMPVSHALVGERPAHPKHQEVLVHTGQHYDYHMSQLFFEELAIPAPAYNLAVGSGSHAQQTAELLTRLEAVMIAERPDVVMVRGDTNSTLGGALVASKLQIPLVHIEAGERSYNRAMPEEINRLTVDAIADLHLCVSPKAVQQLRREGHCTSVVWVGDVMLDALQQIRPQAEARSTVLQRLSVQPGTYGLVTVHRAGNVDDPMRLQQIMAALNQLAQPIIFPAHPRTQAAIHANGIEPAPHIHLIEPVGYLDMITLEANAALIATDSGGVQREAYYLRKPCLTLRDETEWTDIVETGWNHLVGADTERIVTQWQTFVPPAEHPPVLGDGHAAARIVAAIEERFCRGQWAVTQDRKGHEL
ncbi:MAG: UDP-N-acetylglucosamine 2-epimerase (non-hydrolyzing) [Caldilineaceae bacterium]|nr:UDP-N-acetylglucosamine 2-epimerase (non-hydrolyzing) [Caldilineaceae bacterium]